MTAPTEKCPRCSRQLLADQDGDDYCLNCGYRGSPSAKGRVLDVFEDMSAADIGRAALVKRAAILKEIRVVQTSIAELQQEARRFELLAEACGVEPERVGKSLAAATESGSFECDQCDRTFNGAQARATHRARKHGPGWDTSGNLKASAAS